MFESFSVYRFDVLMLIIFIGLYVYIYVYVNVYINYKYMIN